MSEFTEVIEDLFSLRASRRSSLAPMEMYCKALGHPERAFPTIHVGGTNGKGTVATKIARGLEATGLAHTSHAHGKDHPHPPDHISDFAHRQYLADIGSSRCQKSNQTGCGHLSHERKKCGLTVGLYTSPHIISFCERISINGALIPEGVVTRGIKRLRALITELGEVPFFFELTTLLALEYFRRQCVDIAVIEVGMGGIVDSTNVITPLLSVITSVDLEHTEVLGATLDEIAAKKAGIIKKGVPLVIGKDAGLAPIIDRAHQCASPLYRATDSSDIARESLRLLRAHFAISDEAIEIGARANAPCRFEVVCGSSGEPEVIFDVAHNPSALAALFERIEKAFPHKKLHVLFGMSLSKNVVQSLAIVAGKADEITLYPSTSELVFPAEELRNILEEKGFTSARIADFETALEKAADQEAILVVTGSFYVIGEVLKSTSSV